MQTIFELPTSPDAPLLVHGDCLTELRKLPDASVDVIITDPPAGIGFMGKPWDSFAGYQAVTDRGRDVADRLDGLLPRWAVGFTVFMVDVWREADRVLKPGGFVCSWALPKTADLAGLAMRSVGWDIHDALLHLYGGGMPKAGDLSKKIDAMHGAEREVIGEYTMPLDSTAPGKRPGNSMGYGSDLPAGVIGRPITAPATADAERWTDWSSQLAPGHENWLIARKPTPLTYAEQVLAHGCGALHIGACRVPRTSDDHDATAVQSQSGRGFAGSYVFGEGVTPPTYAMPQRGSWPKNVVLTEGGEPCPVSELDRQSGQQRDGVAVKRNLPDEGGRPGITAIHSGTQRSADQTYGSSGGASRFFSKFLYTPKNSDRTAGLRTDIINDHPTPKSIDLMRWLVRLLAAKAEHTGGLPAIVLDPFMGSGSTGVACVHERVLHVGIERDAKSYEIAHSRIMAAIGSPEAAAEANEKAPVGAQLGLL